MAHARIGIIGAGGAVGGAVARALLATYPDELRLGGRRPTAIRDAIGGGIDSGQIVHVDIDDEASLAAFCRGCRVVVNCAGPSSRVLDRVARVAFEAGAAYVDPAGDDTLFELLTREPRASSTQTAVVSAGLLPGLSGLVPRWLARRGFERVRRLTAFACIRDRLTLAAAADYLHSLSGSYGESLAVWRHRRVSRALAPMIAVELPFFPGAWNAYPFLTTEIERTAAALNLDEACWYNVFKDDRVVRLIGRLRGATVDGTQLMSASAELADALNLELFGTTPIQIFVYRLEGVREGKPAERWAVFEGSDTYELTGVVAAAAAALIVEGRIGPGVQYAALALDPDAAIETLRACRATATLMDLADVDVERVTGVEDGVL